MPSFREMVSHIDQSNQKSHKTTNSEDVFFCIKMKIDRGEKHHKACAMYTNSVISSGYISDTKVIIMSNSPIEFNSCVVDN